MRSHHWALFALTLALGCKNGDEIAPTDAATLPQDRPATDATTDVADASDATTDRPGADGTTQDVATDAPSDAPADAASDAVSDVADAASDTTPGDGATDGGAGDAASDVGTDAVADSATDAATCVSDGGCVCAPSTSAEITNRCTGASCAPFNNAARLPRLLPDGGRPPLP